METGISFYMYLIDMNKLFENIMIFETCPCSVDYGFNYNKHIFA